MQPKEYSSGVAHQQYGNAWHRMMRTQLHCINIKMDAAHCCSRHNSRGPHIWHRGVRIDGGGVDDA
jgi:hypothetical protein